MTCSDCKGTGKIVLLTSVVDCGCRKSAVLTFGSRLPLAHPAASFVGIDDEVAKAFEDAIRSAARDCGIPARFLLGR